MGILINLFMMSSACTLLNQEISKSRPSLNTHTCTRASTHQAFLLATRNLDRYFIFIIFITGIYEMQAPGERGVTAGVAQSV
jgi:hypothetical protein